MRISSAFRMKYLISNNRGPNLFVKRRLRESSFDMKGWWGGGGRGEERVWAEVSSQQYTQSQSPQPGNSLLN